MTRDEAVTLFGDSGDEEGALIFVEDRLIAVLCRLGEIHGEMEGRWHLEARFGIVSGTPPMSFASLEDAMLQLTRTHSGQYRLLITRTAARLLPAHQGSSGSSSRLRCLPWRWAW